jgi:hypothetical protein
VSDLSDAASALQSFVAAAGIVVGAIWAYFKFIKDRVYRPRLDVTIEATRLLAGSRNRLICAVSVRNIGASKVELTQEGTVLRLSEADPEQEPFRQIRWVRRRTLGIFEKHRWFESGETVRDELALSLPDEHDQLLQIEVRLVLPRPRQNVALYNRVVVPP